MYYREIEHEDGSVTVASGHSAAARWRIHDVHGPYTVSTVFLGGEGSYETMVFVGGVPPVTVDLSRYPTRQEAKKGHHRISCKWWDIFKANLALLGEGFWKKAPTTTEL